MYETKVEVAKARRKCRGCGGLIPKHHTALVRWEPKRLPGRTVMEKANYCSKCGLGVLDENIGALRQNLGRLADLRLLCQRDYVPEDSRDSIHYIIRSGSPGAKRHILKGRLTERTLCGRNINRDFHKGRTTPFWVMSGTDVCQSCRRRWASGRKAT